MLSHSKRNKVKMLGRMIIMKFQ